MLVPGLAATIALAGASHGALLDHAYTGHADAVTALLCDRRRHRPRARTRDRCEAMTRVWPDPEHEFVTAHQVRRSAPSARVGAGSCVCSDAFKSVRHGWARRSRAAPAAAASRTSLSNR